MEPTTSPQAVSGAAHAPAEVGSFPTIAEDRLEGAEAIGRFIDPNMTLREVRTRLEAGHYPCWKEGRRYVASKAALLKHWREKAEKAAGQPQPGTRRPQLKSARRGYLGSVR
jgi:hypothetical protein